MSHAKRACAADGILEQLERDGIADDEIVERGALGDVAPMKEHLAIVCQADEPRDSEPPTAESADGDECLVVVVIDVGEVTQLGR